MMMARVGALFFLVMGIPWMGYARQDSTVDFDKLIQKADTLFEQAKKDYETARDKSSVPDFIEAGFRLEECRIKFIVIQEIGPADKQKIAAERLRAVNQLGKLIHDGKVAISGAKEESPVEKPAETPFAAPPAESATEQPAKIVGKTTRLPIPEAARQKDAEKLMRDLFKEQFAKKAPTDRRALARTLLAQASKSTEDPPAYWVLCREAQDVAVQVCDVRAAVQAVEFAVAIFEMDGLASRNATLGALGKVAKTPDECADLVFAYQRLILDLVTADQYDAADKAVAPCLGLARRINDPGTLARVTVLGKEVSEGKLLFQAMKGSLETLARKPDDPGANQEMGKFLCYVKGNWEMGLRFILKGSDATLKSLAEKELSFPNASADRMALADGWAELAEKEKSPLRKGQLISHAKTLYEAALPDSTALVRARIEKRLEELKPGETPKVTAGPKTGLRAGLVAYWKFDEGKGTTTASTGTENPATLMDGVEWAPSQARMGTALKFNGKAYVSCKVEGLPAIDSAKTISCWLQYPSAGGGAVNIICMTDGGPGNGVQLGFKDAKLSVWRHGGTTLVAGPPKTNAWHHVAYVYDGKKHNLFINGKSAGTSETPGQSGTVKKCEFGRYWPGGPAPNYTGLLDEVRIYNRALSDQEIQALASGTE